MARRSKRSPWDLKLFEADRLGLGWSFSDLAGEAGLSVQTVSRILGGESKSPKSAKAIAEALGHTLKRYLREQPKPGSSTPVGAR